MNMLSGIRIVEFEGIGPGPFAAMTLADLGAEVITIHRPGAPSGVTTDTSLLDRGKRSIVLDLKNAEDLATARALIETADALIEGQRPGVMERLGLGPDDCHALNAALVYGRMTGWGQTGPMAQQAGHDLNYIATSGALWYGSEPGQPPITPATLVGDIGGGALYLVIGLLSGILNARQSGRGTVVDAAIVDGSAHMMALLMAIQQAGLMGETRGQNLLDGPHWSRSYACSDGYVAVQCLEDKFYQIFLARMGLDKDPDFQRQHDQTLWPVLTRRLAQRFASEPRAHWQALFEGSDACVATVLSPQEAAAHPHMQARGTWQTKDGALQPAPAPRFDGKTPELNRPVKRDADRAAILSELTARREEAPKG